MLCSFLRTFIVAALALTHAIAFAGDRIGQVKVASGDVTIQRDGGEIMAKAGEPLFEKDTIVTGENSAVGMTFTDNSRMSLGPESTLSLESYIYSRPGRPNSFDARLQSGSLTAASGKIAKSRPLAMRVLMPTTVLGVKGTVLAARVAADDDGAVQ
ncbi:MAG: FecR domain-containing protein [Pseudomonadota bacterium]